MWLNDVGTQGLTRSNAQHECATWKVSVPSVTAPPHPSQATASSTIRGRTAGGLWALSPFTREGQEQGHPESPC